MLWIFGPRLTPGPPGRGRLVLGCSFLMTGPESYLLPAEGQKSSRQLEPPLWGHGQECDSIVGFQESPCPEARRPCGPRGASGAALPGDQQALQSEAPAPSRPCQQQSSGEAAPSLEDQGKETDEQLRDQQTWARRHCPAFPASFSWLCYLTLSSTLFIINMEKERATEGKGPQRAEHLTWPREAGFQAHATAKEGQHPQHAPHPVHLSSHHRDHRAGPQL